MKHETNMSMGVYGYFFFGKVCILGLDRPGMSFRYSAFFLDDRTTVDARSAGYNELSWSQSIVALVEA